MQPYVPPYHGKVRMPRSVVLKMQQHSWNTPHAPFTNSADLHLHSNHTQIQYMSELPNGP